MDESNEPPNHMPLSKLFFKGYIYIHTHTHCALCESGCPLRQLL